MAADPAVLAALQAAHNLEATASEKWHKQEHEWKQGRRQSPKLGKWFDRRHKEAYERQHDLRNVMIREGGTVETELGDTSYTDDPAAAFTAACDLLDELAAAHEDVAAALKAARKQSDPTEASRYRAMEEKFHGYAKDIRKSYLNGERKQQQLADLGLPLFLAKHS
jgi:hypothetical protein